MCVAARISVLLWRIDQPQVRPHDYDAMYDFAGAHVPGMDSRRILAGVRGKSRGVDWRPLVVRISAEH
eukprot:1332386-Rhodomonas_salina.1